MEARRSVRGYSSQEPARSGLNVSRQKPSTLIHLDHHAFFG